MTFTSTKINYIELNVSNIEHSKQFYGDAFGWSFIDYGADYCEFSDGEMTGGFTTQAPVNPGGPMIVLYDVALEEVYARITRAGGKIVRETFQFPGGERFEFQDPDGYILAVWRHV